MRLSRLRTVSQLVLTLGAWGCSGDALLAQSTPPPTRPTLTTEPSAAAAGRAVVIERAPVIFRDPAKYQMNLHLEPVRKLALAATVDGVVSSILSEVGQEVAPQAEVLRLDDRESQLKLQRAQAALKASKADLDAATEKLAAEARVQVAETDLAIAELNQTRSVIRSPLKGVVTAMLVVDGEYVRAGQPLAIVMDPSQLVVELPIDRRVQKVGESIEIKIEDESLSAKLATVLPLKPQFDPLRELFQSPATGRVVLDNTKGKWSVGQTVYSPLIPRLPVAEIPNAALVNAEQGGRKVQVIREGVLRDIPVQLLGQIGADYLYVSGRFGFSDELVLKTSESLLDGARVTAREEKSPVAGPSANTPRPAQPAGAGDNF